MTKGTLLGGVGLALVLGGAPAMLPAQTAAPDHPNVILII